ncbi:glycosyltransferase family 39 protein [Pseudomonas purpurea]|uniref:glycosyltransferase family 39 protein n=1 Tax=Pseudomonas purpurea TaxID=3136737 RepID=UPI003266DE51
MNFKGEASSRYGFRTFWWLPLIAMAALVRFYGLSEPAIWSDEGFTLLLSLRPVPQILFHTAQDVHPPLYYVLLHGWMSVFGPGVFSARSFSVLAGVGTVALGIWLVCLISTRRAAVLAGVLLALLPFAVRYSQEVRMYALLGLLLLGATVALVYWVSNPANYRALAVYVLLMVAGLYTHYFAGVCLASHWAYLLVLRCQRSVRHQPLSMPAWWLANGLIVVLFLPWVPSLIHQLRFSGPNWIQQPDISTVLVSVWRFVSYSDGPLSSIWLAIILPVALLAVSLLIGLRDRSENRFNVLLVIHTWFPLALIVVVSVVIPLFVDRYFLFAALGLPMIAAIALEAVWDRWRLFSVVLLVLMVAVEGVGLHNVRLKGHAVYDEVNKVDALAEHLNRHVLSGDSIVVMNGFLYFPFSYYNQSGVIPLLYTPAQKDGTSGRPQGTQIWTLVQQEADTVYVDTLEQVKPSSGRAWVLDATGSRSQKIAFPDYWHLISTFVAGDAQIRLFVICADATAVTQPLCRQP